MPATSSPPDSRTPSEAEAGQAATDRRRGRFVPWIIAGFYLTFMSVLVGFVFIAYAHPPADSTEEAYDKGLAYNETLARASQQAALGWRSDTVYSQGHTTFSLRDRQLAPVRHARVRAWFVHPGDAAFDRQFDMAEDGDGTYWADTVLPTRGLWTVHVTAAVDGDEYQSVTRIEN